jgi:hypothetical protein
MIREITLEGVQVCFCRLSCLGAATGADEGCIGANACGRVAGAGGGIGGATGAGGGGIGTGFGAGGADGKGTDVGATIGVGFQGAATAVGATGSAGLFCTRARNRSSISSRRCSGIAGEATFRFSMVSSLVTEITSCGNSFGDAGSLRLTCVCDMSISANFTPGVGASLTGPTCIACVPVKRATSFA